MKTIEICPGVTVTASDKFCDQYQEEVRKAEWEKQWKEDTYKYLINPDNWDDDIYSDIFKEYYGFRPHFNLKEFWGE